MSFFSASHHDSRPDFLKPGSFRDSLLSQGHLCTPEIARIASSVAAGHPKRPGEPTATPMPFVTIRPQEPSYLVVDNNFRSAAGTRRRNPRRLLRLPYS